MSENIIVIKSKIDPSVNTFMDGFETRFVTREDRGIVYLSSFKGCNQACRMCHLTQTGQTDMTPATVDDFVMQAETSLATMVEYFQSKGETPKFIHYNFMARGEPLLNFYVMQAWDILSEELKAKANQLFPDAEVKFNISTIMTGLYEYNSEGIPVGGYEELPFKTNKPEIYYSLYSVDPEFRRRWLPKAQDYTDMLRILGSYVTKGGQVRFHSAFIQGHNSDMVDVNEMVKAIRFWGLIGHYNIVRFNSPDPEKYEEATEEELEGIKAFLESKGFNVQMVPRVGVDCYASCGVFINPVGE